MRRTPPKANPEAGRAMATGDLVKTDPAELRELAQTLHDKASSLTGIHSNITSSVANTKGEAASFKSEWEPSPKYDGAVTKSDSASGSYSGDVSTVAADMQKTAGGLQWIADNHEEAQKAAAENAKAVDTDLGADSGKGGKGNGTPPATPPTAPTVEPGGPKVQYA